MKKVTKQAIIKLVEKGGFTPIESSWKSERTTEYNRYFDNYSYTEYFLETTEGVVIDGDKQANEEACFEIKITNREQFEKAKKVEELFVTYGFEASVTIRNGYEKRNKLMKLLEAKKLFDDEYEKLIEIVNGFGDVI